MYIQKLRVVNFRNFEEKFIEFSDKTTVIVGPNASGKTNILESINLLSTGKSFKASRESEMINYTSEIARVKGRFSKDIQDMEVILTTGEISVSENPKKVEKSPKKRLLVGGVSKRLIDFAGRFRVVLFGPQDLDLVTESPSLRRRFLDETLSQVDRNYRRAILSYEKGLRQRNKLLWQIREDLDIHTGDGRLLFWDKLLIKNGDYISQAREEFINFINSTGSLDNQNFGIIYDKSAISEKRLEQYKDEEVAAATTLVGPHRDDMQFKIKNSKLKTDRDLASFGSRGEQRMAVLWLKLAELAYVELKTTQKPTLLLDDIFSELDHEHRSIVMVTAKNQQTIITTADPHYLESFGKVEKIELKG